MLVLDAVYYLLDVIRKLGNSISTVRTRFVDLTGWVNIFNCLKHFCFILPFVYKQSVPVLRTLVPSKNVLYCFI